MVVSVKIIKEESFLVYDATPIKGSETMSEWFPQFIGDAANLTKAIALQNEYTIRTEKRVLKCN